jgi:hypothetical protein
MRTGLRNAPRIVKGAFVDSNLLAVPPLIVPFQFNPETIARRKEVSVSNPPSRRGRDNAGDAERPPGEAQSVNAGPETIALDIRLDATDALDAGDATAGMLGVLPALSALELMASPRSESTLAGTLGLMADFGFGDRATTPVVIFVWGRQRVNAVRITSLEIQEAEYNTDLSPVRATVGVRLQVIGGGNPFNTLHQTQREVFAAMNLANAGDLARSIVNF